jgi:hypothetical protein
MTAQPQVFCPVCRKPVPRAHIAHLQGKNGPGHPIVKLIEEERPGWAEEDGACRSCWEAFTAIRCVIRFFQELRNEQRLGECSESRPASRAVANILWLDREHYSIPIRRSAPAAGAR